MNLALKEAEIAFLEGEIPVGVVIINTKDNSIVASTHNQNIRIDDPTAHAEILAIRFVSQKFGTHFLKECDIYTTLEPCPMCSHAISLAKIRRVYFGAFSEQLSLKKQNGYHQSEIYGGIMEQESKIILKNFFQNLRKS